MTKRRVRVETVKEVISETGGRHRSGDTFRRSKTRTPKGGSHNMPEGTTTKSPAKAKATKAKATKPAATKEKAPSKRDQERARKEVEAAKVRDAKISDGTLIVVKDTEFEKTGKDTKTLNRAKKVLALLEKSKTPVVVSQAAEDLGAFYEDVLPQFAMLEAQGLIVRYEGRGGGRGRRAVAYLHTDHTK